MTDEEREYTGIHLNDRAVRVLAHPLRSRILSSLRLHGPATATELAAELNTNTGATSYHLRALEQVELVTDTGEGAGKRRLWRASTDYHSWNTSDFADDEDAQTALGWLQRDYVRQFAERGERWLDVQEQWPAAWSDSLGLSDAILTVTSEQAEELNREISAVLQRYRTAGSGHPDALRLHVAVQTVPVDIRPPEPSR